MLVALSLFLGGAGVGFYSRVMFAFGLSGVVVALSLLAWTIRADISLVGVLVLFAHLAALQAGYLVGAYLRARGRPRRGGRGFTGTDSPEPDGLVVEREDRQPQEEGRRAQDQDQRQ